VLESFGAMVVEPPDIYQEVLHGIETRTYGATS
jgi:hypothetical protein